MSGHRDGSLRGYSIKNDAKSVFHQKNLFDEAITSVTLSPDDNSVLCSSKDGYYLKIYDLRMNKVIKTFQDDIYMNSYDHNKTCFGPDGRFIICGNCNI